MMEEEEEELKKERREKEKENSAANHEKDKNMIMPSGEYSILVYVQYANSWKFLENKKAPGFITDTCHNWINFFFLW